MVYGCLHERMDGWRKGPMWRSISVRQASNLFGYTGDTMVFERGKRNEKSAVGTT